MTPTRRARPAKKAPAKKAPAKKKAVVVGVQLAEAPTRQQLSALKKAFATEELARVGLAAGGAINDEQVQHRRRRRR